jgi:hypothetical protein
MTLGWDDDPYTDERPVRNSRQTAVLLGTAGLALVALVGTGLLLLTSGGGGGGEDVVAAPAKASPSATAAPTTAAPAPPPPPAPTVPAVPPVLGDIPASRTDIGYLRSAQVINGETYLAFDRVQFLTGAAARKAAAAAGQGAKDPFIVNTTTQVRNVKLAPNVQITGRTRLNTFATPGSPSAAEAPRTLDELARFIAGKGPADTTPFRFTYDAAGAVASIREQSLS